jgi:cell division protein FtsB
MVMDKYRMVVDGDDWNDLKSASDTLTKEIEKLTKENDKLIQDNKRLVDEVAMLKSKVVAAKEITIKKEQT